MDSALVDQTDSRWGARNVIIAFCRSRYALLLILSAAFFLRALSAIVFSGEIDEEGAEYGRIAENINNGTGYKGIASDGVQLIFPPLFPLLMMVLLKTGLEVDTAGRAINVIFGSVLVIGVHGIANTLFGRVHALLAATLVAVHPFLIRFSTTVHCEPFYLTLIVFAIYACMTAADRADLRSCAVAGCLYGLAYLVRPEAAIFVVVGAISLVLAQAQTARAGLLQAARREAPRAATMLACFAILAAPYALWLSWQTGGLRIQAKTPLNIATELRMQSGMTLYAASYAVNEKLEVEGIWAKTNLEGLQMPRPTLGQYIEILLKKSVKVVQGASASIGGAAEFGSPMLLILAAAGLFRRPIAGRRLVAFLHLMSLAALTLIALFFIYYTSLRFYLLILVMLLLWASAGLVHLASWSQALLRINGLMPRVRPHVGTVGIVLACALMWVPAAVLQVRELAWARGSRPIKAFAQQLAKPGERLRVADTTASFAIHANAEFTWLPYSDEKTALAYLAKKGVTHVVVNGERLDQVPYLGAWAQRGVPGAVLVAKLERANKIPTWIYRFQPPAS